MLHFQPLNEFAAMLLVERTEAAAIQLVRAIGHDAVRRGIESLRSQDLIDEDRASHLILRLIGELSLGQEQVERAERLGIALPEDLAGGDVPLPLEAVFSRAAVEIEADLDPEEAQRQAREDRLQALEQLRAVKRKTDAMNGQAREDSVRSNTKPDEDGHICPICGEPISRQAVGCRKHWRQVKKMQDPDWKDRRAAGTSAAD